MVAGPGLNTQAELVTDTIRKIKESLDRCVGVVIWAPTPILEFGIVRGYDNDERLFHVIDCADEDPDPLLFDNIGRADVPIVYIQRFFTRRDTDAEKLIRDSLSFGLALWNAEHNDRRYAYGAKAYDNLTGSLAKGDYNPFGLTYVINVYADMKRALASFMKSIVTTGLFKSIGKAEELYAHIASLFGDMTAIAPFTGARQVAFDKKRAPELAAMLTACKAEETEAMKLINDALEE